MLWPTCSLGYMMSVFLHKTHAQCSFNVKTSGRVYRGEQTGFIYSWDWDISVKKLILKFFNIQTSQDELSDSLTFPLNVP